MTNLTYHEIDDITSRTKEQGSEDIKEEDVKLVQERLKSIQIKFTYYEVIWRSLVIILLIPGFILIERVYQFHNSPITAHIQKNSIYDFWVSILVAIAFIPVRTGIRNYFYPIIFNQLNKKRSVDPLERHKRCEIHCKWVFDALYYSIATISGYLIIKNQPFLPSSLLGTGECQNLFIEFPNVPDIPYLKLYYLIQAGAHIYSLAHQLFQKRGDGKFYEYTLHHSLTLFLIWFSYMMNYLLVGTIIFLIHDPSDVFLIVARAYNDLKNSILILRIGFFLFAYIFWVYSRNIILPTCILKQCLNVYWNFYGEPLFDILLLPNTFMIAMLCMLEIMHAYWTFFFTKSIITIVSKGEEKNDYDS